MDAIAIKTAANALLTKAEGHHPRLMITVNVGPHSDHLLCASVYHDWPMSDGHFVHEADDWQELFDGLASGLAASEAKRRRDTIRSMALEIIRLTAEFGICTDSALRGTTFSSKEVRDLGAEAAAEANDIAGLGPFSIVIERGDNGAPRVPPREVEEA